ncbi:zinc finger protein ZAT5 [Lathyrus oleraceus]|uniref:zinc finger protein ZAT5 n=1 Tax=Pisum sativum TaxID=3888 RepID=UPI001FC63574|nr:zinc finger protein ZAT5-like [Pisum sativum]
MEPASNHHQHDHHQHDHQQQQQQQLSLASKELSNIIKGKRTKRVRPQSPMPFSITANSSTGEGGGTGEGEGEREDCYNGDDVINTNNININIIHNNNNTSPTTSYVEEKQESVMDDEEHDMANCLILLAQGQSKESPKTTDELDGGMMNYTKYSSRKFMEAATLDSGRAGFYVYECKTCNRTFPSFQALGGHRASHKKPKALAIAQERKQFFDDDQEFQFKPNHKPISLQLNNNGKGNLYGGNNNNNKSKVHECSICGSEFTSGQALGGHMRRHRAPVGSSTANTTLSLTPMALEPDEDHQPRKKRNVLSLDLDLNLPAPEDDQKESKFAFASKQQHQQQHGQKQHQQQQQQQQQQPQQQTNLVFSAPALVDCHY